MKKGQVTIFITFIFISIIIITIAGVLAPMGVLFNTKMLTAGEEIINRSQADIANIQDVEIRTAVQNISVSAMAAGENNIIVNNQIYKYSAVIMIVLAGLVVFLFTRQIVEVTGRGGFI